ncbi:MAG: CCA tRNA nucleotidyltransferase [Candidatus Woesearchaeota archaeon]|nr:MAG: CCA tRNA nucleotidyltransferase [Candidatus Woesearchaeota archaeon]
MKDKITEKIIPSKKEQIRVEDVTKEISKKINDSLKKQGISAKLTLGGSVAKGTWLPGDSDIDFFLQFCRKYKNISDLTEKILKGFKAERVKGSRDYFNFKYKGFDIEIVPVLETTDPKKAENITDISPLHVNWIKEKIKGNKNLQEEIKIAKLFLKAQKCYGAESYIKGFSGHVTDILVYYYKSFDKFIKEASKWKSKVFIDAEKHYKNKEEAMAKMNQSKLYSPIIVVDPIQPERNAAAALDKEKFNLLIKSAKEYLKKPDISFFKEKRITLNQLKKNKNLIVLESSPTKKRKDIAGAELLKRFQKLKRKLKEYDFNLITSGWQWYSGEKAMYWFSFKKKGLSKTKRHDGPPLNASKEDIAAFKGKWKNVKKDKRYYVIVKRKYTKPEDMIKKLKDVKIIYSS